MPGIEFPPEPHTEDRDAKRIPLWRPMIHGGQVWQWMTYKLYDESGFPSQPEIRELCAFDLADGTLTASLDVDQAQGDKSLSSVSLTGAGEIYRIGFISMPRLLESAETIGSVIIGNVVLGQTRRHGIMAVDISDPDSPTLLYRREYIETSGDLRSETHYWPQNATMDGKLFCTFERFLTTSEYLKNGYINPSNGHKNWSVAEVDEFGVATLGESASEPYLGWRAGHSIQAGFTIIEPSTGDIIVERVLDPEAWSTQVTEFTATFEELGSYTGVDATWNFDNGSSNNSTYIDHTYIGSGYGVATEYNGPIGTGLILHSADNMDVVPTTSAPFSYTDPYIEPNPTYCASPSHTTLEKTHHGCSGPTPTIKVINWYIDAPTTAVTCSAPLGSSHCDACIIDDLIILGARNAQDATGPIDRTIPGAMWVALNRADLSTAWTYTLPDEIAYLFASKPINCGGKCVTLISVTGSSRLVVLSAAGELLSTIALPDEDYTDVQLVATPEGVFVGNGGELIKI